MGVRRVQTLDAELGRPLHQHRVEIGSVDVEVWSSVGLLAIREHGLPVQLRALVGANHEGMREHRELADLVQDSESLKDPGRVGRDLNSGSDLIEAFVSSEQVN
jgi:hypothetical protein